MPGRVRVLLAVVVLECLGLLLYTAGIAVSAIRAEATVSSPVAEVVIYVLFVAGMAAIARGVARRSRWARAPYIVVQMFGLVVAWTLFNGDGAAVAAAGAIVACCSALGLVLALSPSTSDLLDQ